MERIETKEVKPRDGQEVRAPKNYRNPYALNISLEGKNVVVSLANGRIESGSCSLVGQYFMAIKLVNGKSLIIAKSAIVTVSVL